MCVYIFIHVYMLGICILYIDIIKILVKYILKFLFILKYFKHFN